MVPPTNASVMNTSTSDPSNPLSPPCTEGIDEDASLKAIATSLENPIALGPNEDVIEVEYKGKCLLVTRASKLKMKQACDSLA